MKKTFKISVSYLAIGGFLLGGFLLGGQLLLAAPDITVDTHLNFGAYTVTPIQLNQGENIECALDENGITECENATPVGNWAQVGEFTLDPYVKSYFLGRTDTDYAAHAFIKVSYIEGSLDLEEAGVALELTFKKTAGDGTLKKSTGNTLNDVADLEVFKPRESPVSYLLFDDSHFHRNNRLLAAAPRTITVYGKLIVEDPVKFFAYRTKHNITDVSKLLGTLNFLVYEVGDIQTPRSGGGFYGTIPHNP